MLKGALAKILSSVRGAASRRAATPTRRDAEHAGTGDLDSSQYAPRADGDADPGEVVWTWVAYEDDPSQGKDRPVVVLGRDGGEVVTVALTTKGRDRREYFPLGAGPWDPQHRDSWVKLDRLIRVDADGIRREGAALSRERYEMVLEAVAIEHGWRPPS